MARFVVTGVTVWQVVGAGLGGSVADAGLADRIDQHEFALDGAGVIDHPQHSSIFVECVEEGCR